MTALSLVQAGAYYKIKWNVCTGESAILTEELGLCPGTIVFLTNSYFGNVIVRIKGKKFAISREVAACIKV